MKKLLFAVLPLVLFAACKKCDDPDLRVNTLNARINGQSWQAAEINWFTVAQNLELEGREGGKLVRLTIPAYRGAGTYALGAGGNTAVWQEGSTVYNGNAGQLEVTTDNVRTLEGTFRFNAATDGRLKVVESGTFRLSK